MLQPKANGANKPLAQQPRRETPLENWEQNVGFRFDPRRDPAAGTTGLPTSPVDIQTRTIGGQVVGGRAQQGYGLGRITGPVAVLKEIAQRWKLKDAQLVVLLGLDPSDAPFARMLLDGHTGLRGRDQRDRVAYMIAIDGILHSVFRDPTVEFRWMSEPKELLEGDSPLQRMLKGSMEDLLFTRQVVEVLAGA